MSKEITNPNLTFLESADDTYIGAFDSKQDANTFDALFAEAVDKLESKQVNYFMDATAIVKSPAILKELKKTALSGIMQEAAERGEEWGTYARLGDQIDKMWDNVTGQLTKEMASVGSLRPISLIDYPVLVKQHISLATKDVVQTTVVDGPVVKKQIEHTWVVDNNHPSKRWEYPQCFFNGDWREIWKAGKGIELSNEPQTLPIFNVNLIDALTDAAVPEREKLSYNLHVVRAITKATTLTIGDETVNVPAGIEIPMEMSVNMHLGNWIGGHIDIMVEDPTTKDKVRIVDELTGQVDWTTSTCTLTSASGAIDKVVFGGYLSNEKNERSVSFDYTREEKTWAIEDGHRVVIPYSVEELEDHQALLKMDLYRKSYTNISKYLTDMEDSQVIGYLDDMFDKYAGLEVDPLAWASFVRTMDFNCDSTGVTTALPSEYIENELKFYVDRFILDLTEMAKMEDMTFVIYGNPRYISLLGDKVKWVIKAGKSTTGGIKHNYSYGVMTTGSANIQVVSALKFSATDELHRGLRIIPFPTTKEQMTFGHFKWSTHVMTNNDSAYRDANLPGGSKTILVGVSRYTDEHIQGIQGYMTFSAADFVTSKPALKTSSAGGVTPPTGG